MSYYPPNAEGGAYGPPAGNANQNQGPPKYVAPAPQQGYSGYPAASMGHPGGLPPQGVHGQQGGYPAYHAPPGHPPAPACGAPSSFNPAVAPGSYYPDNRYPGASYGTAYGYPAPGGYHASPGNAPAYGAPGYAPPMMPGHQGGYPAPGRYPAPAGNAHAYGAPAGSQFPDNRASYGPAHASFMMQGVPGQQGGYPAYHAPPGHHAYGAPAPFYPAATAPGSSYPGYGYPGAYYGPGYAPAQAPPASDRPNGVTSFSDASGTPVPAAASVGDMPHSLSGMSINAPSPGVGVSVPGESGAVSAGTPVYGSGGVYGSQTPNNMQGFDSGTNLSAQRDFPTRAAGPSGNADVVNMPAAAVSVTEPNRCSCAPVDPAAPSEIPEEYEFISREGSLSLTEPPSSGSCGCHAADPHAAASIREEYEVIPPTGSVPVTQPPRGCSCGCHPADPATAGSRSAAKVGDPAPTSLIMSGTINILVMYVNGTTTDDQYHEVDIYQQYQVQLWWNYAKNFYKDRTRNLNINIKYQSIIVDSNIKIPLVPPSEDEAEKNWRNPAVKQWLTAHSLVPSQAPTGAGLIDVNTLVEYTRDHGPDGKPGDWAFVCFITNLPHFAGTPATPTSPAVPPQSPTYFGAKQRVVQYYEYNYSFGFSSQKNLLAYTHEMAHVFGAKDEYVNPDPAPCNGNNGVPNYNAVQCLDNVYTKTNCLMNETGDPDADKMCYYTRGQIGWPVMQPIKRMNISDFRGVRKYGAMSAVSYDNKLWVFFASSNDNYIRYYNSTDLLYWAYGTISDWKVTQSAKSSGAVGFNDKLYLFFELKDTNKIMYGIYDKNTNQWRNNAYDLTGPVSAAVLAAVTGSYISAVVLGTSLYVFYERLSASKTISALRFVPSSAGNGTLTLFDSNVYTFPPSYFGLTTDDIKMAAVTVLRQTKKVSGVDVTTQKMVIAYTQYSLNAYNAAKPVGVLSCSFADGVSTIVGATWNCNPNGPQLQTTSAEESLSMLAICSSNSDFGAYYLAGVDNTSNDVGAVNRSSSTDLQYFAPAVKNSYYGFGGVANAVFNNTLVTFSGRPGSGFSWLMWHELGYGV